MARCAPVPCQLLEETEATDTTGRADRHFLNLLLLAAITICALSRHWMQAYSTSSVSITWGPVILQSWQVCLVL